MDGVGDKLDAQNKGSYAVFGLKHPGRSGRRRLAARGGLGPNARAYWATRSSGRASILDHARPNGLGRPELAPHPFVPIRYDPDDRSTTFSPRSALCGGLGVCPGPKRCYVRVNDDRATHKEGVRAAYKCAEGPPGSKWNLAADTPPSKRVGRRAYKRAREELAMLEREARPKQKPVKTL